MQPDFEVMPGELRALPRWVVWKGAKVPYCATTADSTASVTDPDTWAPFPTAQTAFEEGGYAGVGFVLNGDGIVGVDLDKCVSDGVPQSAAFDLLNRIGCQYVEVSPSGNGLRGFGYGDNIKGRRGILDGLNVELYSTQRYLTVTGHALKTGPLVPLPGFSEVAHLLGEPPHPTEDNGSLRKTSHVIPSSVSLCLPANEGERNRCLFELARRVKGERPEATREELRAIVQEWHQLALPVIATKAFSVSWGDFERAWRSVRHAHGETLRAALDGVDIHACLPEQLQALGYGEHEAPLLHVCKALQVHAGNEPFFIGARTAAELLGHSDHSTAAAMLRAFVADGVLEMVSKGAGKVASRYRYVWAGQSGR